MEFKIVNMFFGLVRAFSVSWSVTNYGPPNGSSHFPVPTWSKPVSAIRPGSGGLTFVTLVRYI
jgi:hypothetical protein